MNNNFGLKEMLNFNELDLTVPNKVVEEILAQLSKESDNIICGEIDEYNGPIVSYTTTRTSFVDTIGSITAEKRIDIQDSLGKQGEEVHKFECYLYTPIYEDYKYRMFFMKYGLANYPVQFTLEESIARSIYGTNASYIVSCKNREELEELIVGIIKSKKIQAVMQEIIRIYQVKKAEKIGEKKDSSDDVD